MFVRKGETEENYPSRWPLPVSTHGNSSFLKFFGIHNHVLVEKGMVPE